ncbi:MAG: DUF3343 domain-containing protein [Clostridia bacterium]|jgi:hypothetical protein|nr:DUF3343 domain-containing protein [Lachnospiraceae bacterium]NCB99909.1 DUF3343 domain-containing protein [Clostridia bacterium]NCD03066.1 DUF3343 domain-containing protein [Clostridia bacterium]
MARIKQNKVVYTFSSTVWALKMEQCCREKMAAGRLIPIPKDISAGCGMAWTAGIEEKAALDKFIKENEIEVEGIYEMLL